VVGLTTESMMINDALRDWAMKAWEKEVIRNSPGAKAGRSLRASLSQSRKDMARARRSLASRQASSKRKLDQHLADLERASSARLAASDREFEEKRWQLLIDSQ